MKDIYFPRLPVKIFTVAFTGFNRSVEKPNNPDLHGSVMLCNNTLHGCLCKIILTLCGKSF